MEGERKRGSTKGRKRERVRRRKEEVRSNRGIKRGRNIGRFQ